MLIAALLLSVLPDLIHLKDGRVWQGDVIEEEEKRIKIKLPKGAIWVARDEIEKIESAEGLRNEYRDRASKSASAEEHRALALWCRERALPAEERTEWEAVARLDPEHEEAHTALGHVRHDGRWMTAEEAARAKGLVQAEGEWVTPLRAELIGLIAKAASEDLVERGEAKRALKKLGDEGRTELEALAEEARGRLAAALAKEQTVMGELQARAKAARVAHVAFVQNELRFPSDGVSDAAMRQMREGVAELERIGREPARAYVEADEALARVAARLARADAALGSGDRLGALFAGIHEKLGPEAVFRAIDPYRTLRAKSDEENAAVDMGESERALLDEINTYRLRCGRAPLRWDDRLESAARQHSGEMKKLKYFSHVSPVGKYATLVKRMDLVKFKSQVVGENLALGDDPADVIRQAFQDSPGHHRNLLVDRYTRVGIARESEYWTVNFGGDPE